MDDSELKTTVEQENSPTTEFYNLLGKHQNQVTDALFEYCYKHNIFFDRATIEWLMRKDSAETLQKMPEIYIDTINANPTFFGLTFFDQLKIDNFEKIYSEDLSLLSLNDDDKKNRQQAIDILGYDPFADEPDKNRAQLSRDLAGMLTEGMRKDIVKSKAALSIVRSYQNIENYQQRVTELMSTGSTDAETQDKIDQYLKVISSIQNSVNQTAEKNNFAVKGIGVSGRGMLSDVMNQIEEKGIDEGITNFYDIATSEAIEYVANISFKAQLNQLNLSQTDYADILANQAELVRKAQRQAKDAMEALRLAKEKITKQELIDELAKDYRKKGISEEEIQEFIKREYEMYDASSK